MRKAIFIFTLFTLSFSSIAQDVCKDRVEIIDYNGRKVMFSNTMENNEIFINVWKIMDLEDFVILSITIDSDACVLKGASSFINFIDGSVAEIKNVNDNNCKGQLQFTISSELKSKLATADIKSITINGSAKGPVFSEMSKEKNVTLRKILYCIYN